MSETLGEGAEESKSSPSRPGATALALSTSLVGPPKAGAGPMGTPSAQLEAAKSGKGVGKGASLSDPSNIDLGLSREEKNILENREKITEDMLQDFVSSGTWANLQASCEEFLLHAAFLVVPHTNKNIDTGEDGSHGDMGQLAFKAHMKELDSTEDPDMRREIVRTRFRGGTAFLYSLYITTTRYGCYDCFGPADETWCYGQHEFSSYLPHAS